MESYDESDAIERAWRDGLKPDPLLTVSQWADRYRVLSQRASSEPGRWRTERTPYLKEIMDCLSPASPVQRVALMKGAQIGGTCSWCATQSAAPHRPQPPHSPATEGDTCASALFDIHSASVRPIKSLTRLTKVRVNAIPHGTTCDH